MVTPFARVQAELVEARREGASFDLAWSSALVGVGEPWRQVLVETWRVWRDAYELRSPAKWEVEFAQLQGGEPERWGSGLVRDGSGRRRPALAA